MENLNEIFPTNGTMCTKIFRFHLVFSNSVFLGWRNRSKLAENGSVRVNNRWAEAQCIYKNKENILDTETIDDAT